MAIGATFGALNCMYSAIASRQVEIATLRAIGFGELTVVVSVMIEALLLALLGGAVGGALAYVYCDGASLSTLNFNTFSQVAFDFRVTPRLLAQGLVWGWSSVPWVGCCRCPRGAAAGDAGAARPVGGRPPADLGQYRAWQDLQSAWWDGLRTCWARSYGVGEIQSAFPYRPTQPSGQDQPRLEIILT